MLPGVEPGTLGTLGKCFTPELNPQPLGSFCLIFILGCFLTVRGRNGGVDSGLVGIRSSVSRTVGLGLPSSEGRSSVGNARVQ